MIYCLQSKKYPKSKQTIEKIIHQDKNNFKWKINRIKNGFFIKYIGNPYFKCKYFNIELLNGKHFLIDNTNCIFIKDEKFETFANIRNFIKNNYTDNIWDYFEKLLKKRFKFDKNYLVV